MEVKKTILDVCTKGYNSKSRFVKIVMQLMDYINDPIDENELIAISGIGLCFPWKYDSMCDDASVISDIPKKLFNVLGYKNIHFNNDNITDKTYLYNEIKQSINAGHPVIGFGINSNMPYSCLIIGYDEFGLYIISSNDEIIHVKDWFENCNGIIIVGKKVNERLKGKEAYNKICEWALYFRITSNKTVGREKIPLNWSAFPEMKKWIKSTDWDNEEIIQNNIIWLKNKGLELIEYYRNNLYDYLWKMNAEYPGVVNLSSLIELEAMKRYFNEVITLMENESLIKKAIRDKTIHYISCLEDLDHSLEWTLFMKNFIKSQTKNFKMDSFEYCGLPAFRFIGFEGEEYSDISKRLEMMKKLDRLEDCKSGFDYDLFFMHHYGHGVDKPWHGVWGRFMKENTSIPEGFIGIDFKPFNDSPAGPPYFSEFAFAKYSGNMLDLHSHEGYDCDAMYDTTRNTLLGSAVVIPYPEKYWYAEVFIDGCDKYSTGYLFSIGQFFSKADLVCKSARKKNTKNKVKEQRTFDLQLGLYTANSNLNIYETNSSNSSIIGIINKSMQFEINLVGGIWNTWGIVYHNGVIGWVNLTDNLNGIIASFVKELEKTTEIIGFKLDDINVGFKSYYKIAAYNNLYGKTIANGGWTFTYHNTITAVRAENNLYKVILVNNDKNPKNNTLIPVDGIVILIATDYSNYDSLIEMLKVNEYFSFDINELVIYPLKINHKA